MHFDGRGETGELLQLHSVRVSNTQLQQNSRFYAAARQEHREYKRAMRDTRPVSTTTIAGLQRRTAGPLHRSFVVPPSVRSVSEKSTVFGTQDISGSSPRHRSPHHAADEAPAVGLVSSTVADSAGHNPAGLFYKSTCPRIAPVEAKVVDSAYELPPGVGAVPRSEATAAVFRSKVERFHVKQASEALPPERIPGALADQVRSQPNGAVGMRSVTPRFGPATVQPIAFLKPLSTVRRDPLDMALHTAECRRVDQQRRLGKVLREKLVALKLAEWLRESSRSGSSTTPPAAAAAAAGPSPSPLPASAAGSPASDKEGAAAAVHESPPRDEPPAATPRGTFEVSSPPPAVVAKQAAIIRQHHVESHLAAMGFNESEQRILSRILMAHRGGQVHTGTMTGVQLDLWRQLSHGIASSLLARMKHDVLDDDGANRKDVRRHFDELGFRKSDFDALEAFVVENG